MISADIYLFVITLKTYNILADITKNAYIREAKNNNAMKMEQLLEVSDAVSMALDFLYQECDAICDEDYYDHVQGIISKLEKATDILNKKI